MQLAIALASQALPLLKSTESSDAAFSPVPPFASGSVPVTSVVSVIWFVVPVTIPWALIVTLG